jgi:hypothetical protein
MYFKLDLSFYMFAIIFFNEMNGQNSKKKVNSDKYFKTNEVLQYRTVQLEYRVRKQSDNKLISGTKAECSSVAHIFTVTGTVRTNGQRVRHP